MQKQRYSGEYRCFYIKGNTAQRLCKRYAVNFFVRLYKNFVGILTYVKKFMCDMTENWQVDFVQSSKAVFVRCCQKKIYTANLFVIAFVLLYSKVISYTHSLIPIVLLSRQISWLSVEPHLLPI